LLAAVALDIWAAVELAVIALLLELLAAVEVQSPHFLYCFQQIIL
jgi:hypothetical protein